MHSYYDVDAMIELKFNLNLTTRGNKFKLKKFPCHYNIRKYSICSRITNIWNSLQDYVVQIDSINAFKSRLDKLWADQGIVYYRASYALAVYAMAMCLSVCVRHKSVFY